MDLIVQLPVLFFSIMFHEVSHGWLALRHGDDTAKREGRLSFNPIDHIDPLGTLILPTLCLLAHVPPIGWAKPVPVNPAYLRGGLASWVRVALIGPVSNIALSLVAAVAFKLSMTTLGVFPGFQRVLLGALLFAVQVNLFLAFFNLVPIHPLDGSKVLSGVLPWRYRRTYDRHQPYGFALILLMVWLGLMGPLVSTPSALTMSLMAKVGLLW